MSKNRNLSEISNITGIVKSSTSGFSGAVAGSDYQSPITLTTTGTSGVASFSEGVLNVPNYGDSIGAAGSAGTSGSSGNTGSSGSSGTSGANGSSGTSGAGTISGGTSGYVAKFTGSTALSSSVIYESSSTIGINVTDQSAALDVYKLTSGGTSGGASLALRSGNSSDTFNSQQILFSYAGGILYSHSIRTRHMSNAAAGNSIDFYTWKYGTDTSSTIGTQHVMTIDGNARVGIQSTTPEAPLHIGGSTNYITIGNNFGSAHSDIRLKANNKGEGVIWKASDTYTSWGGAGALNIYNSTDLIAFHPSAASNTVVMTSNGIGIGNTNPKFYLHSNADVTIPNNRYLTFNTGEISLSNFNKALVVSYSDDTATSQPKQVGVILHNNSNTDNTFSPGLVFGSKSASSSYSQATAMIAGRRLTAQGDNNWHGGELYFWTATSGGATTVSQGLPDGDPAMIIDSRRRVRKTFQPAFQVHRSNSEGNQSISSNTDTKILFSVTRYDVANNMSNNGRFTAPVSGRYFFCSTVRYDGASTDASYLRLSLTVNGSSGGSGPSYTYGHVIAGPGSYSTNYHSMTTTAVLNLAANDYVEISGGISSGSVGVQFESQFSGYFLG